MRDHPEREQQEHAHARSLFEQQGAEPAHEERADRDMEEHERILRINVEQLQR